MEVGQKIYLEPLGNAARRSKEIKEVTISKIGRKYFQVEEMDMIRFNIDDLVHDGGVYSSEYQGYLSKGAIADKMERERLHSIISREFNTHNPTLTLDKLKAIDGIIKSNDSEVDITKQLDVGDLTLHPIDGAGDFEIQLYLGEDGYIDIEEAQQVINYLTKSINER